MVIAVVAAALVATGVSGGAAWALWSDELVNPSLQVATGSQVGVGWGRVGGTVDAATGPASALTVTLGQGDAQALIASPSKTIAVPLVVRLRADGNAGITYSIALPTYPAGSLFGASTVRLFPITATTDAAAQAACTLAAAPSAQPPTMNVVGIPPGADAPTGIDSDYWCLTAAYSGTGGTYQNTATARGTAPSGVVAEAQSTWQAFIVSPGTYTLTHSVTLPGSP